MNLSVEKIVQLTRHCTGCDEHKPFDAFYSRKNNLSGKYRCKSCEVKANKERRANLPVEVVRAREKAYMAVHKERNPNYYTDKRNIYGPKEKATKAAFYKANPDARRNIQYKSKFGLTIDDVRLMLANQGGLCANRGCGQEIKIGGKRKEMACVDHCHATGKVRGMLCLVCNTSLGHLENKNRMLGLTEYLQKYGVQNV